MAENFNIPAAVNCPEPVEGTFFVYMLLCKGRSLYYQTKRVKRKFTFVSERSVGNIGFNTPRLAAEGLGPGLALGFNTRYCGSTSDMKNRLQEHASGEAALWTKMRRPVRLVYYEEYPSLIAARRREKQVKGWTRAKKMNLVDGIWKQMNTL